MSGQFIQWEENIGKRRIKVHGPVLDKGRLGYRCVHKIATDAGGFKEYDKEHLDTVTDARLWFDQQVSEARFWFVKANQQAAQMCVLPQDSSGSGR